MAKVEIVLKAALSVGVLPSVKRQTDFLPEKVLLRYTIICGEAVEVLDLTL